MTTRGNDEFPDSHGDLTAALLRCVRNVFGASGLKKLISAHRTETTARYRSFMESDSTAEERLAVLSEQRTADGFMAQWEDDGDGRYRFIENHCSISAAARVCDGLCKSELEMFQDILGQEVKVERISHLLSGASRCSYRITKLEDRARDRLPGLSQQRRRLRSARSS